MKTKPALVLAAIFIIMYALNSMMPFSYGDDYLYHFMWQGKPMGEPLGEDARRVASLSDVFVSQYSHYTTWGGRAPAHILTQLFCWLGKPVFNFFNSLAAVVLTVEIHWLAEGGRVSLDFSASRLAWIFFCLWSFTVNFGSSFLWLAGACNYLWTSLILLAFLLPYVRLYLDGENKINPALMFFAGILAGWTNEHTVCWILAALFAFIVYARRKKTALPLWAQTGFLGLAAGYALLIFAPGNFARLEYEKSIGNVLPLAERAENFLLLTGIILCWYALLWFYIISTLKNSKILDENPEAKKLRFLAKMFSLLAAAPLATMFFSPVFTARMSFPSLVFLIISAGILIQMEHEYRELMNVRAKKLYRAAAVVYFSLTLYGTLWFYSTLSDYNEYVEAAANEAKRTGEILELSPFVSEKWMDKLTGLHNVEHGLTQNAAHWKNVAFARYYEITGVVEKSKPIDEERGDS